MERASIAFVLALSTSAFAGPQEELFTACKQGNLEGVQKSLEAGANPNTLDSKGESPLAAAFFWPEITKLLLDKGADPNLGKHKPLFQAAVFYSLDVIKLLLERGADPNKPSLQEPTELFTALIATERKKGAAANTQLIAAWENAMRTLPPSEVFTLSTAIYGTKCGPCIELLLEKGARIDKGTGDGNLLHTLANSFTMRKEDWAKAFNETRSRVQAMGLKIPDWYSDAMPPERIGSLDKVVKMLVAKGMNINERNKGTNGMGPMTPLEVALNGGMGASADVMLALVHNGADVRSVNPTYGPLIIQAAQTGYPDVVRAMVEKGADINAQGTMFFSSGKLGLASTFTPLTAAAHKNHTALVKYLLSAGGSSRGGVSGTIVVLARQRVGELQQQACVADAKGKSAIFFAVENDNLEMAREIAEHNDFDGKPFSFHAKKMTNCLGGGQYGPSEYAKEVGASAELIAYLKSKGY